MKKFLIIGLLLLMPLASAATLQERIRAETASDTLEEKEIVKKWSPERGFESEVVTVERKKSDLYRSAVIDGRTVVFRELIFKRHDSSTGKVTLRIT